MDLPYSSHLASKFIKGEFLLLGIILLVSSKTLAQDSSEGTFPNKHITVVVPFGAGGGTDTFGRYMKLAIRENELLSADTNFVIENVPGAGATLGSRRVKDAKPDGYTILLLHDALITAEHYGNADYGLDDFIPIAATGRNGSVIVVHEDSEMKTLKDMTDHLIDKPNDLVFGANFGATAQYAALLLEQALKPKRAEFRYTQAGSGASRYEKLYGKHIDSTMFALSEYDVFKTTEKKKGARALAILAAERDPKIPEVPTAMEQGVDLIVNNHYYWWAPKGTPQDRIDKIADILEKAIKSEYMKEKCAETLIKPVFMSGEELSTHLVNVEKDIFELQIRKVEVLKSFPLYVLIITIVLVILLALQRVRNSKQAAITEKVIGPPSYPLRKKSAVITMIASGIYVALMPLLGYILSTILFASFIGCLLVKFDKKLSLISCGLGIASGLGIFFIFTEMLQKSLPQFNLW